ncbi:MAG: Tat pathway signal protein [Acidobacteria bacterium]|nr:MAG: Tat pathway signal protein [Acidobacteriota bacterium]
MDRRRFLQRTAVATAAAYLPGPRPVGANGHIDLRAFSSTLIAETNVDVAGHTLISEFTMDSTKWKVYEDLRTREGAITFISSAGARVLTKSAEASFAEETSPYLGLTLKDIGMSARDLLAERLLEGGNDPDPDRVKSAAPPLGSVQSTGPSWRLPWDTFVGTKECFDTMPVFPSGNTRTYHPVQYFPDDSQKASQRRFDGLVGGWMPAVRKIMSASEIAYDEVIVFGDVEAQDKFIVQTWHRTARIETGKMLKAIYGHSYPAFPPARTDPQPEKFYRALLRFVVYWESLLSDFASASVPQNVWLDMSKHAFAKEVMARPGGVYPKYGAVDRDYYGSEYDGFQDIFTSSVYTNLEWGRFKTARAIIDNYFSDFVDGAGMINMRGPEIAQFGMTLSLLARYSNYTGDRELLEKHRAKIEATATLLCEMHEESLRLSHVDPGYGLIHGWSESDSCLMPKPQIWWLPYYANNAFAARGLRDLSRVWNSIAEQSSRAGKQAAAWELRSKVLQDAVVASIEKNIRHDMTPPYIGTYAGATGTFWESMQKERPSPQQWPHRPYAELLQADMLSEDLSNLIIDCMRAYGGTTLGVLANIEPPHAEGRDILGFISYGYAQALLRLDRIEEFLLFLYSHRYHDHTRGSWTAGEVAGIDGDNALFCIPAQLTIPIVMRWMLVLEDSDEDRLYFGKGLPREWVISGKEIRIERAPTRWGRVSMKIIADATTKNIQAEVGLERLGSPREIQVKLRLPKQYALRKPIVNGRPAAIGGLHNDNVIVQTGSEQHFQISAEFA